MERGDHSALRASPGDDLPNSRRSALVSGESDDSVEVRVLQTEEAVCAKALCRGGKMKLKRQAGHPHSHRVRTLRTSVLFLIAVRSF